MRAGGYTDHILASVPEGCADRSLPSSCLCREGGARTSYVSLMEYTLMNWLSSAGLVPVQAACGREAAIQKGVDVGALRDGISGAVRVPPFTSCPGE